MDKKRLIAIGVGFIMMILHDNLNFSFGPIPEAYVTEAIAFAVGATLIGMGLMDKDEDVDEA